MNLEVRHEIPICDHVWILGYPDIHGFGSGESGSSGGTGPNGQFSASFVINPRPFFSMPITGAPYSAIQVSQGTQHMSRDSAGRTRTERPFAVSMTNNLAYVCGVRL